LNEDIASKFICVVIPTKQQKFRLILNMITKNKNTKFFLLNLDALRKYLLDALRKYIFKKNLS